MYAEQEQKLNNIFNWSDNLKVLWAVEKWQTQQRSLVDKTSLGQF